MTATDLTAAAVSAVAAIVVLAAGVLTGCGGTATGDGAPPRVEATDTSPATTAAGAPAPTRHGQDTPMLAITANGHEMRVELADNSSARALISLLQEGNVEIAMSDYGDFEKVGSLPRQLPTNDERITTRPGDVILYQGDKLTIYYDTNTWTFTRLGTVVGLDEDDLRKVLGAGDVTVTLAVA